MLSAFIKQTYGNVENANKADQAADLRECVEKELMHKREESAKLQMCRDQSICNAMNIPTRLKPGELDGKTVVHEKFKNYDHSLEIKRDCGVKVIELDSDLAVGDVSDFI